MNLTRACLHSIFIPEPKYLIWGIIFKKVFDVILLKASEIKQSNSKK